MKRQSRGMTGKLLAAFMFLLSFNAGAQPNRIDLVRSDAPELARFGDYVIGVRTVQLTDPGRPDILNTPEGGSTVHSDRTLTVEIWYPAALAEGEVPGGQYQTTTRNTSIIATLHGSALRDAAPLSGQAAFPLVIISHGYPGNRYLISHLAENLASKGYVVASIDHPDSTYTDQQAFSSTLYNRTLDQRFVLERIASLSADPEHFLYLLANANQTAVVGYSMGGYGLINNLGAGFNPEVLSLPMVPPNGLLAEHTELNPDFRSRLDTRIKAGIAIAPWGMNNGMWRSQDLQAIEVPTLYVAGSADIVSGYQNGTRSIFEKARNSDRYLLTFENAGHNAGAPIPVPVELLQSGQKTGVSHYIDAVWDTLRMNNIMDHFITAFLDYHLKGRADRLAYLTVPERSEEGWKGFDAGPAIGLRLEHLAPEE